MEYKCSKCGATGCKLWRQYNTFLDSIRLMCTKCGAENQNVDINRVLENGRVYHEVVGECDYLGNLIPAVPCDETFWGFTSIPQEDVDWWRALPTWPVVEAGEDAKI